MSLHRFGRFALAALVLSLASPAGVSAQLPFDLRGGFNLSQLVGDEIESDTRTGLDLGIAFTPLSAGPLALVAEVYYRQKGGEGLQELSTGGTPSSLEIGLDYIEVQPLLRFGVPLSRQLGLYVQGGPAFGWQIDCSVTLDTQSGESSPACDDLLGEGLEDTLRQYEQGIAGGAGLELVVFGGAGALTLDGRLTRGLTALTDEEAGPEINTQTTSLMLGYRFSPSGWLGGMR